MSRNTSPREVVRDVIEGRRPPYVPWSFGFTHEARSLLAAHFGDDCVDDRLGNHLIFLGNGIGFFEDLGDHRFRDAFGVVWNRSVDRDIGNVEAPLLQAPTLNGYSFPDPRSARFFADIPSTLERYGDRFRVFAIGFSLYERAWTLRGMENLMLDFIEHPGFVHDLLGAIADYTLEHLDTALTHDIDAVYFGDDWGQQHGLQMGPGLWREFIAPQLKRLYGKVRGAGKSVFIHSCGDVHELFDDLIDLGVNCFNPFQPEVMNVAEALARYRGRLAFHGGLSTQRILPFGTPDEVRAESKRLLALGREGGYIFSPAHAVEGDVPLANMLAFIEEAINQPGAEAARAMAPQGVRRTDREDKR